MKWEVSSCCKQKILTAYWGKQNWDKKKKKEKKKKIKLK